MASFFKTVFGEISASRVLDVATGRGGSIGVVIRNLKDFSVVFGIDNVHKNLRTARKSHSDKGARFLQMDAERMEFVDRSFDLVVISNSLHHLVDPEQVLFEMFRVLKVGGKFVINEPHCDATSESQRTSVYLHHWIADIDTALGFTHNNTFKRQQIIKLVGKIGLKALRTHDRELKERDAFTSQTLRRYEKYYIEKFLKRAVKARDNKDLFRRGEELRKRLYEVGTQIQEPLIVLVGEK